MSEARLAVSHLSVRYDGVSAVSDVDLVVGPGEVVGLIGPNGAGKTSAIDAISGFVPHDGTVVLGDIDLSGSAPHQRARAGLARTWQSVELFEDLTVRQNCAVAANRSGIGPMAADLLAPRRRRDRSAVDESLDRLGLSPLADRLPDALSHGQQKLVGVARALSARPSVLLLDEPAAGLDANESAMFGERLRGVVDDGPAALLVDHDTRLVLDVCDRVYVLDFGSVIAMGTPDRIRTDDRVIQAYLGVGASGATPDPSGPS